MARLAREMPWCCKLSGLVTEAKADWQTGDLAPYVDHLLATFGPDRLMWGSDVFGGTAPGFYRLDQPRQ
jgi:L-fuconolactonase